MTELRVMVVHWVVDVVPHACPRTDGMASNAKKDERRRFDCMVALMWFAIWVEKVSFL